jgi:hypothetical protein
MQNKFVVGGKYRIKSKSIGDSLLNSNVLRRAREIGQDYLYFVGTRDSVSDGKVLCFTEKIGFGGDYFLPQDVEVYLEEGEKYTPIQKSKYGILNESVVWNRARSVNQPFLYFKRIDSDGDIVFTKNNYDENGDIFTIDDIIPYIPNAEIEEFNLIKPTQQTQTQNNMESKNNQFTVDEKFIKDAYEAACSEWKEKIRKKFPEAFPPKEFEFGKEYVISTQYKDGPIAIGFGSAPTGKEHRCLVVHPDWNLVISQNIKGVKVLEFIKK